MNNKELKEILEKHLKWLNCETGGERANLRGADLYDSDLRGANLRGADLYDSDLRGANLRGADLYDSDLRRANLRGADLYDSDLRGADLCGADLCGADLRGANLYGANLYGANLYGANLCEANLYGANLYGANLCAANLCEANLYGANLCAANLCEANLRGVDLCEANLYGVDLYGADLYEAKNTHRIPMTCPDTGSFIGWKKATLNGIEDVIVKLEILEDAKRSSATSRKCRCDKAKVLAIETIKGESLKHLNARSEYDTSFIYTVGKIVSVDNFDEDRWNECAPGIHFFINRQEAVEY